jgi:hypothetical protein
MRNTNDAFENAFRDQLEGLEKKANNDAFEKIVNRLDSRKKRRGFFWIAAIFVGIISAGVIGWYSGLKSNTSSQIAVENSSEKIDIKNSSQNPIVLENKVIPIEENIVISKNESINSIEKFKNNISNPSNNISSTYSSKKLNSANNNSTQIQDSKISETNLISNSILSTDTKIEFIEEISTSLPQEQLFVSLLPTSTLNPLPVKFSLNDFENTLTQTTYPNKLKTSNIRQLNYAFGVEMLNSYATYTPNANDQVFISSIASNDNFSSQRLGWRSQFSMGKNITNHFYSQMNVSLGQIGLPLKYTKRVDSETEIIVRSVTSNELQIDRKEFFTKVNDPIKIWQYGIGINTGYKFNSGFGAEVYGRYNGNFSTENKWYPQVGGLIFAPLGKSNFHVTLSAERALGNGGNSNEEVFYSPISYGLGIRYSLL